MWEGRRVGGGYSAKKLTMQFYKMDLDEKEVFVLFCLVVLRLELRAYTLSLSTSPIFLFLFFFW
jgi:hypothetical protein